METTIKIVNVLAILFLVYSNYKMKGFLKQLLQRIGSIDSNIKSLVEKERAEIYKSMFGFGLVKLITEYFKNKDKDKK